MSAVTVVSYTNAVNALVTSAVVVDGCKLMRCKCVVCAMKWKWCVEVQKDFESAETKVGIITALMK